MVRICPANRTLETGPAVLGVYALVALALSVVLLLQSRLRGPREFAFWLAAYAGLALVSLWKPRWSPLIAGSMAFLLGIVKTHRAGPNLDLGLSLIALSVGVFTLDRLRRGERRTAVDPAGFALLLVAVWSLISLAFALARIRGFTPAPGFDYHVYPYNALGFTSDEAIIRATIGATAMLCWFGLYEYGRSTEIPRRVLRGVVAGLLLLNTLVLVVQQHVDPFFLLHAGRQIGRLNGVTSYCYALGDASLALFLLLPAWGALRGRSGLETLGCLAMLAYAVQASGSRTVFLAMILAALLWAGRWAFGLSRTRRRFAAAVFLGGLTVALALGTWAYRVTPPDMVTPVGRLKFGVERDGALGHLVTTRLSTYQLIARVLEEYPLSGVGAGLYLGEVSKQHALLAPDVQVLDPYLLTSFAPSQFLNTAVEVGLPALLALAAAFAFVGLRVASGRHGPHCADLAVSLVVLVVALQLAPSFYTSEAAVFFWLVIGLAARCAPVPIPGPSREAPPRVAALLIVGAALLGIGAQLLARPSLAVESQWQRLRWPMNLGLLRPEEGGRWTRPQATATVAAPGRELRLRWHAGDVAAPGYRARVSFYVDGVLVQQSLARAGIIAESVWALPEATGRRRISVRVDPPFFPGAVSGSDDPRKLGIFIHAP